MIFFFYGSLKFILITMFAMWFGWLLYRIAVDWTKFLKGECP